MAPFDWLAYQPSLDGVLVDICECDRKVPNSVENPRVEPIAPEVACKSAFLVVGASKIAEQPSHNRRETFAIARPEKEMDVFSITQKLLTSKR